MILLLASNCATECPGMRLGCTFNYDQQNAEHRARSPVVSADRTIQVSGGFAPLILKVSFSL